MKHPSPEQWQELVEEFRSSGLQQKEFAAKHELHLSTLQYWLYRGSKTRSKSLQITSKSSPKFFPIEVLASPAPTTARGLEGGWIEAWLKSGTAIRFPVGTDTRYLAQLLAALG
jgi:hypothetical protein